MIRCSLLLAPLLLTGSAWASQPTPPDAGEPKPPPVPMRLEAGPTSFEFRSGLWINLHHALWAQAFARVPEGEDPAWRVDAPEADRPAWDACVAFYRDSFEGKDLLFDPDLRRIDLFLSEAGAAPALPDSMTPWPDLSRTLEAAAPIYRATAWPAHDEANRRQLALLRPILEARGNDIATELSRVFGADWPQGETIVDLVIYANWAGAYTSRTRSGGHVRLGPVRTPGDATLATETLWHESSHLLVSPGSAVGEAIAAAGRDLGVEPPRDLWHMVIFHATPDALRRLGVAPPDYIGYAERFGLYERSPAWSRGRDALDDHWAAYVAGDKPLKEAMRAAVAASAD